MADGWIKLHRKIMDCSLWENKNPFDERSAWIDLLLLVNHKDKEIIFKGQPVIVKAGQRITSIRKLADRWHWSINRVKRYTDLLEKLKMISKDSDNHRTLITIVNYGIYQGERYTDEYTDEYTGEYTDGHQTRMNKNDKNEKKSVYGTYKHVKLLDSELEKLHDAIGETMTDECITFLDEYIEMKGYKAKSHYLCIKKWVVDAVKERKAKTKQVNNSTWNINSDDEYTDIIAALEGKR